MDEIKKFIKDNFDGNSLVNLSKMIKDKFNYEIKPKRLSDITTNMNLSKLNKNIELKEDEIFRDIPDFSNYEISQYGNIRHKTKLNYLTWRTDRRGYITIKLSNNDFIKRNMPLHRLLAFAWLQNDQPDIKIQVDHIDGNKKNNSLDNLEWVSPKENLIRARINNLNKSKPPGRGIQTDINTIKDIYLYYKNNINNINYASIGRLYNLSPNTVKRIINKERYKDITDKLD